MNKILVVDDEVDIAEVLAAFLIKEGYDVVTAYDGNTALQKFSEVNPSLILLDIQLPDINGIEVLGKIKGINKDINVIMITAFRDADKVVEAFRLGAYDCIFKPFDFNYLKNAVLAVIGKADLCK
ncbi:MAG: response regulator [Candidatus Firestonebacteria bacterium]